MLSNPVQQDVIPSVSARYSPYLFADKPVADQDLVRCFEAARWAASSFNDQPWSWVVARKRDRQQFDQMLGVLAEPNRGWAATADVLAISITRTKFRSKDAENRVALHDLGAAAALMSLQAASLGLQLHQMAGLDVDQAAETFGVPQHHRVQTAIAIGHPMVDPPGEDQQSMRERELDARKRLSLVEQVFGGKWGTPAVWVPNENS